MTPLRLPTTTTIFRNALLLTQEVRDRLLEAQAHKHDLNLSLETIHSLEILLSTPPIGLGMSWWLKLVATGVTA